MIFPSFLFMLGSLPGRTLISFPSKAAAATRATAITKERAFKYSLTQRAPPVLTCSMIEEKLRRTDKRMNTETAMPGGRISSFVVRGHPPCGAAGRIYHFFQECACQWANAND